ncbi:MAG: molecular chaperone HtpG [Promethearchaeota archaeon]
MTEAQTHEFKAEIKKLLDILSKSLYQHKEIFLRELVSNSSDALKKMHFIGLSEKDIEDPDLPQEIEIILDQEANKLIVRDTGIGMTKDEMIQNLGTIAGSGSQKFLEQLEQSKQESQEKKEIDLDIIGQFGIGFYSVFMVAKKVEVLSKSYKKGEPAYMWVSDGSGKFEIDPAEKSHRGTDVILYLNEDNSEYLQSYRIESIIKKYSNFVPFPIYVSEIKKPEEKVEVDLEEESETEVDSADSADSESSPESASESGSESASESATEEEKEPERTPVNQINPIWKRGKSEITDDDYLNFYHYISKRYDNYLKVINYKVDGRVQFRAILFIPESKSQDLLRPEVEYGLALYSKNVMIMEKSKEIVPQWMRFVYGIVESDDIPLNISRETIQTDRLIMKIEGLIVKRFFKEMMELAQDDSEKYKTFWKEFGPFVKEGIVTDFARKEKLLELLRFRTNKTGEDEYISLKEYVDRMQEGQDEIYYLIGENLDSMRLSPHLGYYEQKDYEVIFFDQPIDNFLMMNVHDYTVELEGEESGETEESEKKDEAKEGEEDKKVKEKTYPFKPIDVTEDKKKGEAKDDESEKTSDDEESDAGSPEMKVFLDHVKALLGDKIIDARVSDRLYKNACRLANPSTGMTSSMQRAMRYWTQTSLDKSFQIPRKIFEFNPDHEMVSKLVNLYQENPDNEMIDPVIEQMFENCLLAEGDLPEPANMVPRLNQILELMVTGKKITDIPRKAEEMSSSENSKVEDAEIIENNSENNDSNDNTENSENTENAE